MSNQTTNATQVTAWRLTIKNKHEATANTGTTGTPGHRNARGNSGCVFRKTSTAIDTIENAANVPILISSASTFKGTNAPISPKKIPTSHVVKNGVAYFGCTRESRAGNNPSRDIAKITRVWPYAITRITVSMP